MPGPRSSMGWSHRLKGRHLKRLAPRRAGGGSRSIPAHSAHSRRDIQSHPRERAIWTNRGRDHRARPMISAIFFVRPKFIPRGLCDLHRFFHQVNGSISVKTSAGEPFNGGFIACSDRKICPCVEIIQMHLVDQFWLFHQNFGGPARRSSHNRAAPTLWQARHPQLRRDIFPK